MPNYERGQTFQPTTLEMVDGSTSPPPLLTEADLIALMEKHGIGKYCNLKFFIIIPELLKMLLHTYVRPNCFSF